MTNFITADYHTMFSILKESLELGVDLQSNTINIFGDIGETNEYNSFNNFVQGSKLLVGVNNTKDITVMINSPGGDTYHMMAIIDYVNHQYKTTGLVYHGTCYGLAASAAGMILTTLPGTRSLSKNGTIMLHQVSADMGNQKFTDATRTLKHYEIMENSCYEILHNRTNKIKSVKFWKDLHTHDTYLTAQEAKKLNLIDIII